VCLGGKRVLDPSTYDSIPNWSINKDRGRQREGSEDDKDKGLMHKQGVDYLPLTARSRTLSSIAHR